MTVDLLLVSALFVLFMINTWYQHKLGFRVGSQGGYAVGMYHAICWLMANKAVEITDTDTGEKASALEVLKYMVKSNTLGNIKMEDPEEMHQIAKIFTEADKLN